jgi:hypothetical protein
LVSFNLQRKELNVPNKELETVEECYERWGFSSRAAMYRAVRENPSIPRVWVTQNALRIPRAAMQRWVEEQEAARRASVSAEVA